MFAPVGFWMAANNQRLTPLNSGFSDQYIYVTVGAVGFLQPFKKPVEPSTNTPSPEQKSDPK
jgi:hypothetical protein